MINSLKFPGVVQLVELKLLREAIHYWPRCRKMSQKSKLIDGTRRTVYFAAVLLSLSRSFTSSFAQGNSQGHKGNSQGQFTEAQELSVQINALLTCNVNVCCLECVCNVYIMCL